MCFGGGGKSPYNAYSSGYFNQWEDGFKRIADREIAAAQGGADISTLNDFSEIAGIRNTINQDGQANMDAREMRRQHSVKLGQIGIDRAFDRFNDDYFGGYQKDYVDYYNPQIEDQYATAKDKLTAALAGRGLLESSVGADALADLTKKYNDSRTNVSNEALDAANKLRGQVETQKSNLYSLNEASADPQAANAQAVGQATALVAPQEYTPMGDLFAGILAPFLQAAGGAGAPKKTYQSPYAVATPKASGSSRVVS